MNVEAVRNQRGALLDVRLDIVVITAGMFSSGSSIITTSAPLTALATSLDLEFRPFRPCSRSATPAQADRDLDARIGQILGVGMACEP